MIATLTMNATIDISSRVENVTPEHKLRCQRPRNDPGGGGINVARACRKMGSDPLAIFPAGGPPGEMLMELLAAEQVRIQPIAVEQWTRQSLTVTETASNAQYRFVMPGPELSKSECEKVIQQLKNLNPVPDYFVASGSLPPGVPRDFYAGVARCMRDRGSRVIVDTSGDALKPALEAGVDVLKPNLRELQILTGLSLETEEEQEEAAATLLRDYELQAVVVSLGAGGVLLVTKDLRERLHAPTVRLRSRVGAGDSMVAGIVLALNRGDDFAHAVRYGLAAGTAAVKTPGTELCRLEDVESLYERIMKMQPPQ